MSVSSVRAALAVAIVALVTLSSASVVPTSASAQAAQPRRAAQDSGTPVVQAPSGPHEGEQAGPAAPSPTLEDLDAILQRLRSSNPDEVREAIDLLSVIDRREVIAPLAELLRSGVADPITDRALEALRGLADPSSIDVLSEFTRHRRAGARRRAYLALAAIEDRRIPALLEQGLRDSERSIRASCATALGQIGARGSLDVLFHAFERGVVEAAAAIGKLGNEGSVERYTNHLGRQPLSVMLSGYEEYLRRADIAEGTKIEIVNRLGEVSGRAVREFLALYQTTFSVRDRSRLRQVVQDVIRRIPIEGDGRRTTAAGSSEAGANGGGQ